jgi:hypothetical protein
MASSRAAFGLRAGLENRSGVVSNGQLYAERHVSDRYRLGPDAAVEITITN